jgi:hypothetical protein
MKFKRSALLLLAGILLMSCFACNNGDGPGPSPGPKPTPVANPTATPTSTPTPTATTLPVGSDIQIHRIFYSGRGFEESNEYVSIKNYGDDDLCIEGWELIDITDGEPIFRFPFYILKARRTVRVYTNEVWLSWGGFTFYSREPVWNNTVPDTAALYNSKGELVSTMTYEIE